MLIFYSVAYHVEQGVFVKCDVPHADPSHPVSSCVWLGDWESVDPADTTIVFGS